MNIEEEIADLKNRVQRLEKINDYQTEFARYQSSKFTDEDMKRAKRALQDFENDRKRV